MNPSKDSKAIQFTTVFLVFLILNTSKQICFDYLFAFNSLTKGSFIFNLLLTSASTYILYFLALVFRSKLVFLSVYILQMFYLIVCISYFEYFKSYPFWGVASDLKEGLIAASHFAISLYWQQLVVFADLPIAILLVGTVAAYSLSRRIAAASTGVVIILCMVASSQRKMPWQVYRDSRFGTLSVIQNFGLLSLQTTDFLLASASKPKFKYGPLAESQGVQKPHPNIVMIQVESLDATIIGKTFKGHPITPFLTHLSTTAIYYPYTMSYHLAGGSSDAEFSILNNVEPLVDTVSLKLPHYPFDNSFCKVLTQNGYQTLAFHANTHRYFNRGYAYRQMGYNDFFDLSKMGLKEHVWGGRDEDLLRFVAEKTRTKKSPFFFHVITISSHGPFNFIPEFKNADFDDIDHEQNRRYYNSIQYVDKQLEHFFKSADLSNTYVVIYGDHSAGINSNIYKSSSFIHSNRKFEFVPLIIVTPNKDKHKENHIAASFLDIGPTILNISGVPYKYHQFGENLLSSKPRNHPPIHFLGGTFDRASLFSKAMAELR